MREAWKRPAVANREAPEAHFTLEGSALYTTHMASSSLAHQISSLHSFQIFYSDGLRQTLTNLQKPCGAGHV